MTIECVSRTDVGLRRKINEDSLLARPGYRLWAVADGMGGHEAGEVASAMVVDALSRLPPFLDMEGRVEAALAALARVNRELIALARSEPRPRTIGSTAVAITIEDGAFRCLWAGDSRAYRVRAGSIEQLTRDHSLVQELVDAGMLAPEEAEGHPNANVVTRAVGVVDKLRVDGCEGDAQAGDIFLLASDGLTRVVPDEELLDELTSYALEEAADRLVETVLSRGAPDNVSLIILRVV